MRFPLVVGVVLIHNFGTPQAIPLAEGGAGLPVDMLCCNLVRWSLSDVLGRLAVPLFFLFSGYLFFATAQPWSTGVYVAKLRRRIHTLLLPYMGWNILQLVAILALALLAWWVKGEPVAAKWPAHTLMEWLRLFWASAPYDLDHVNWLGHPYTMCAPVFGPMWFVRDLMVMCLLAPVVRLWVRYACKAGVLLLALCYVSEVWPLVYGLSVTAVFFFTWGAYLAINGCNLVVLARRYRVPCAVATLLLVPPMVWFDGLSTLTGHRLHQCFVLTGGLTLIALSAEAVRRGWCRVFMRLSAASFFVYAAHLLLVSEVCRHLLDWLVPGSHGMVCLLRYLLLNVVVVGVSLGLYALLRRFMPRLHAVLSGGR